MNTEPVSQDGLRAGDIVVIQVPLELVDEDYLFGVLSASTVPGETLAWSVIGQDRVRSAVLEKACTEAKGARVFIYVPHQKVFFLHECLPVQL